MKKSSFLWLAGVVPCAAFAFWGGAPAGYVSATDYNRDILVKISLAGRNNFIGRSARGYSFGDRCYLRSPAAQALALAQENLRAKDPGLRLYVTECWRPPVAAADLISWAQSTDRKSIARSSMSARERAIFQDSRLFDAAEIFRPLRMFQLSYLSQDSVHSRGSAVDVTIVRAGQGQLDMGTGIDVFSLASHRGARVSRSAAANRALLNSVMSGAGFSGIRTEWWHWNH